MRRALPVCALLVAACGSDELTTPAGPDADFHPLVDAGDSRPPDTTITEGPPAVDIAADPVFTFEADEPATFECRLDADAFVACVSPYAFTDVPHGAHVAEIRAIDDAGNVDPTPAAYAWTADRTIPETTIDTGPPSVHDSTSATFTFSATGVDGTPTFKCKHDAANAFFPCTSPTTFDGYADGMTYTVSVYTLEDSGNFDPTPATWTWTVDTTP